jgi:hypothetical protein
MGQIGSSGPYDDVLEKAALAQMQRCTHGGIGSDEDCLALRDALRALETAFGESGARAVRLKSPHRKTGLAWEMVVLDFLEDPGDLLRQTLLTLASARVIERTLDLPIEFMASLAGQSLTAARGTLQRFCNEAGRSGAILDGLQAGRAPELRVVPKPKPKDADNHDGGAPCSPH